MGDSRAGAALSVQRVWRGVRARRHFSELFFQYLTERLAVQKLQPEPSSAGAALDSSSADDGVDLPSEPPEPEA